MSDWENLSPGLSYRDSVLIIDISGGILQPTARDSIQMCPGLLDEIRRWFTALDGIDICEHSDPTDINEEIAR